MKSIKEKSNEYAEEQDLRMAYNGSCDNCRQGFVAGANYVIEQIEDVLTHPRRYVNPDKSVEEGMVDALIKCVEQLKK